MYKQQEQVAEMYRAVGHPTPASVFLYEDALNMQANLIAEEADELVNSLRALFVTAYDKPPVRVRSVSEADLITVIDGICDLLYVTYGAAVVLGLDIEGAFNLVHENNMTKVGGERRADGKILKPPGYVPVDLKPWLKEQP